MNVTHNEEQDQSKKEQQAIKKQEIKADREEKNFKDQGHPEGCYCRHHMKIF
jgi:hypothetical protein